DRNKAAIPRRSNIVVLSDISLAVGKLRKIESGASFDLKKSMQCPPAWNTSLTLAASALGDSTRLSVSYASYSVPTVGSGSIVGLAGGNTINGRSGSLSGCHCGVNVIGFFENAPGFIRNRSSMVIVLVFHGLSHP